MELMPDLKRTICALFEVHDDANGVQRIVTPLEYPGSSDKVIVRVRPRDGYFQVDENGEAALYASMHGGDVASESVSRWSEELQANSLIEFDDDEVIKAEIKEARLIAPYIIHIAAASQQLFALATSQKERSPSDFKDRVAQVVQEVCEALKMPVQHGVELPIAGGLEADHVIGELNNPSIPPLIVIAASSATRLLEAEIIHMQYRHTQQRGFVLAVAESEKMVGKKQFHRANYYTGKTVEFSAYDFGQLLREQLH